MSVKNHHPEYDAMVSIWEKCRDAKEGEYAIHAKGTKYLPRLIGESEGAYKARKGRTPFFGATGRTVEGMAGMIYRKPPLADLPAGMDEYIENIDVSGKSLDQFSREIAEEILTVGRVGVLTDYPPTSGEYATLAQAETSGIRPSLKLYRTENIINWRETSINNTTVLAQVVLAETQQIGDDEFKEEFEPIYRVLDLESGHYRQRVFRIDKNGDDELIYETYPTKNGQYMDYIPFCSIGYNSLSICPAPPPIASIADMNLHHYTVTADYEHGCHLSGLPTLFITGYTPNPGQQLYVGGPTANILPQSDARAFFVEITNNFTALRENLDSKEKLLAVLGARILEVQKSGVESAEAIARRQSGEESILAKLSQTISDGITKSLIWFADWAGISGFIGYDLNRDFLPTKMDPQTLTALVSSWQMGAISHQTLFDNLKSGEIISPDLDFEEEQARIGESPIMGVGGAESIDI